MKRLLNRLLAGLLLISVAAGASAQLVVGGKNFTEQLLLASMTDQYLKAHDFQTETHTGLGSTVLRKAQLNGQVDLYWGYIGTSLIVFNDVTKKLTPEQAYQTVQKLDAEKGLVWLEPSDANNTYALAMREQQAEKLGIETLSDLAAAEQKKDFSYAFDIEFPRRPDGWRPLQKVYGFHVPRSQWAQMAQGLTYKALKEGRADVAQVTATDGRIQAFNLRVLKDDKSFFPYYAITPVVRKEALEKHPKLKPLLNKLSGKLNDDVMTRLNAKVAVDGVAIKKVAHDFLVKNDLI